MPNISVLMSVKNGERFVGEAVKSILEQSYGDFEFLVLDNASTDRSVEIIGSFGDPRIRLVKNETDLGQTKALNKGLALAKGRYLARMDADDVSLKDRFQKQVEAFERHPATAVVGTWHQEIDEQGRFIKNMRYPVDPLEIKCHLMSDGDLTRRCFAHPTVMMKTDVLRERGGYNESIRFAQDYELWTRLFFDCEMRNIPEFLFQYRSSKKSTSNENRQAMSGELDRIVDAMVNRLWPDVDDVSLGYLTAMLRNRLPSPGTSSENVLATFDALFQRLFGGESLSNRQLALRERIKMYYWPRLATHDLSSAVGPLRSGIGRVPSVVADNKFHKNIAKSIFRR